MYLFAMAISLPILISVFGFDVDALLPVLGFMIGIMKGSTIGGAVPAILFNTPGTPDSMMTTLDGYPMTKNGEAGKALEAKSTTYLAGRLLLGLDAEAAEIFYKDDETAMTWLRS